jgi:vacuole morphology and inheritance protein 14
MGGDSRRGVKCVCFSGRGGYGPTNLKKMADEKSNEEKLGAFTDLSATNSVTGISDMDEFAHTGVMSGSGLGFTLPAASSTAGGSSGAGGGSSYLTDHMIKMLCDKSYEKRKLGAMMIQNTIRNIHATAGSETARERILKMIGSLNKDFVENVNPNHRKGGLIGLAAVALALKDRTAEYLDFILPSILMLLADHDYRVRYYACESLYNIVKVARESSLKFLNRMYDGLCLLYSDIDADVRNGAHVLDKVMREVIVASEASKIDIDSFLAIFCERLPVKISQIRSLSITWLLLFDSLPSINMTKHLPKFLPGLLHMLNDAHKDIRHQAEATLANFLQKALMKNCWNSEGYGSVWLAEVVNILIGEARSMHSPNEQMIVGSELEGDLRDRSLVSNPSRLTAIQWVTDFVLTGGPKFIEEFPDVIDVSLVSLSDKDTTISGQGQILGRNLLQILKTPAETSPGASVDVRRFIEAVEIHLVASVDAVRACAAEWLVVLIKRWPHEMSVELQNYFISVLQLLSDDTLEVTATGVEILATIAQIDEKKFGMIFHQLVQLLSKDSKLAQERMDMIILRLIEHLGANQVYAAFCHELEGCEGQALESAQLIVQSLSKLLLTAKVTEPVREELKSLVTGTSENKQAKTLFKTLFSSFCFDAVAVISLCLVAECFELGSELIAHL